MQRTAIETITPAKAHAWLQKNTGNRALRRSAVTEFARQMTAGKWLLSHQGIAFDTAGTLHDGQHRLHAIIEAGIPVKMTVTYDVDPESFSVVDSGVVRTIADRLPLLSDKESNRIAVAIVTHYLKCTSQALQGRIGADLVDNEFLDKTDAYIAVTNMFRATGGSRTRLTKAAIGAAIVVYVHLDKVKGTEFCTGYLSGTGLSVGQPAHTLRESVLRGGVQRSHDQYWKTTSACIADAEDRRLLTLVAATKDLYGNVYRRLLFERREKAAKGAETRKGKKAQAAS